MAKENRQGVQSLEKGVSLLAILAETNDPMRLADIADKAGMSRSQAHAYLTSLVRAGMASQDVETSRYTLGEMTLQLGMSALRKLDLVRLGRASLLEIQKACSETSFLATWSNRGPLIVAKIEDPGDSVFALQVGAPVTFHTSASGRIFMAHLPRDRWKHLLPGKGPTALSEPEIRSLIEKTRRDGIASVDPVTLPSHSVLSAPVFDHDAQIKAAISLVGPRGRFDNSLTGRPAKLLRAAAADLSRKLGAPPDFVATLPPISSKHR
jgi:DNA-binding IclR family transcriptional regulator